MGRKEEECHCFEFSAPEDASVRHWEHAIFSPNSASSWVNPLPLASVGLQRRLGLRWGVVSNYFERRRSFRGCLGRSPWQLSPHSRACLVLQGSCGARWLPCPGIWPSFRQVVRKTGETLSEREGQATQLLGMDPRSLLGVTNGTPVHKPTHWFQGHLPHSPRCLTAGSPPGQPPPLSAVKCWGCSVLTGQTLGAGAISPHCCY